MLGLATGSHSAPRAFSFTAAIAALSLSGSRERTTKLVFGFLSSSWNG